MFVNENFTGIKVSTPKNDIYVLDNKFISDKNAVYYMEGNRPVRSKFYIKDNKGKELYVCQYQLFSDGNFKDSKGNNILSFKIKDHLFSKQSELNIKYGENDQNICCMLTRRIAFGYFKFYVEFYNKATERNEILDVQIKFNFKNCNIYYGKQKENGQLICSFSSPIKLKYNFKIEIAPNVDHLFINALVFNLVQLIRTKKAQGAASAASG